MQHGDIVAIIVQVVENGVVIHTQHFLSGSGTLGKGLVEPQQVFLLDVAVAHLHERTAIHSYHHQIADFKDKAVVAPEVVKSLACALAPVVLMIAGNHVEWLADAVHNVLHVLQLRVATLVGEVAREHHRFGIGCVDFGHGLSEFPLISVAGRNMNVAENCNLLCLSSSKNRHNGHQQ